MFKVSPKSDAIGELLVFLHIAPDTLLTGFVEFSDAILLNVMLTLEAKFLLDLQLDRQTMRIPPATSADDILPTHTMIAYNSILHCTRLNMMDARTTVCSRW